MKSIPKFAWIILSVLHASRMVAQEKAPKPPEHFYRLVFQVEETDSAGKVINSRSYSTVGTTENTRGWPIKTGSKIPLHTSEKGDIQYIDIGVNIDTQDLVEQGAKLHLVTKVDISSLAPEQNSVTADPIIRQNNWSAEVLIPIGKPSVIFSADNLENKGRTQVELTAIRLE